MAKGYTDQENVENFLLTTIDGAFLTQFDTWVEGVEAFIEGYTGRVFIADASASARRFVGDNTQKLLIDDCVAITKVEQGDFYGETYTEITSGNYEAFPLNETPKTMIGIKRTVWGAGIHRVTAKWGYSVACPADVKFAATVLVAGIINTQTKTGTAKIKEKIGNYEVQYSDENGIASYERAMAILNAYRKLVI